jgi:hypothetical protein
MPDSHRPPSDVAAIATASPAPPLADSAVASAPIGQFGAFALLGAAAGTVPLPWVPDALARRLRGALVQDITARHGLALTPAARLALSDPGGAKKKRSPFGEALRFLSRKLLVRFGPLALWSPVRAGIETYVLGHLLDRYVSRWRKVVGARMEVAEARMVREAIERAVVRVASPEMELDWPALPLAPEDSRDELTQAVDGLLRATTTVPSWLLHRLDAAFDDALSRV